MGESNICDLLRELSGSEAAAAWESFLEEFGPIIRQVILLSIRDSEAQSDCFVFVCEALAARNFRRLRAFKVEGRATFATWLRAVVRNLCLDWRRKVAGRFQPFAWTRTISTLDQEVFRCVCARGYTVHETVAALGGQFPELTAAKVEASVERLSSRLSGRERWLLSTRAVRLESLDAEDAEQPRLEVSDSSPDPECAAMAAEYSRLLNAALGGLPPRDQLILRLRFEEGFSLQQVAHLAGLKDAQAADRHVRSLLDRLRGRIEPIPSSRRGKAKTASV